MNDSKKPPAVDGLMPALDALQPIEEIGGTSLPSGHNPGGQMSPSHVDIGTNDPAIAFPSVPAYLSLEEESALAEEGLPPPNILEVVGADSRQLLSKDGMPGHPWAAICHLRVDYGPTVPGGLGTGFLIHPRVVVTAGHVVLRDSDGALAQKILVAPGRWGKDYAVVQSREIHPRAFRISPQWENGNFVSRFDYAALVLQENEAFAGVATLRAPLLNDDQFRALKNDYSLRISGYPKNGLGRPRKPFATPWWADGKIRAFSPRLVRHAIDTAAGQSGAPLIYYTKDQNIPKVVGIHVKTEQVGRRWINYARRVDRTLINAMKEWIGEVQPPTS